uniref:Uncharacterized protein n=1 Tax=Lygus hesperus TaxID=30085 RepID=A0A0A9YMS2_LYGHE
MYSTAHPAMTSSDTKNMEEISKQTPQQHQRPYTTGKTARKLNKDAEPFNPKLKTVDVPMVDQSVSVPSPMYLRNTIGYNDMYTSHIATSMYHQQVAIPKVLVNKELQLPQQQVAAHIALHDRHIPDVHHPHPTPILPSMIVDPNGSLPHHPHPYQPPHNHQHHTTHMHHQPYNSTHHHHSLQNTTAISNTSVEAQPPHKHDTVDTAKKVSSPSPYYVLPNVVSTPSQSLQKYSNDILKG